MVSGNIANEYGDIMIASFNKPLIGIENITDWNIVVGLKTEFMTGSISVEADSAEVDGVQTQFSIVFNPGDKIIIGNVEYEIDTITTNNQMTLTTEMSFTASGLDYYINTNDNNKFEYEFRWSQSGKTFSEFDTLDKTVAPGLGDLRSIPFNKTKPVYIDTKFEVIRLGKNNSLAILSIDYVYPDPDTGNLISCPNVCFDDVSCDSFGYNGCANIHVVCDDNQFQPYKLDKSNNLYKQLVNIASDIFGHEVQYFRTEPDLRTSDVILMEYSLHNVVAQDTLKILVPDNEFPSEANTYDIFGIEYAEFEIHITATEFERVFGSGKKPRNKDYMFIPLINRMYEINSLSIADEFNKTKSYWRIKLVKYQERSSVSKNEFDVATDSLTTGIEEIFGEQIATEYEKNTKPDQYQTVSTSYKDGIREFISKDLQIIDFDLKNKWTVVSKNYYDLTSVPIGANVLQYDTISKVTPTQNAAFTGWFKPQFDSTSTDEYFLFGDNTALTGFKMYISSTSFKILVNGDTTELTHGITLDSNKWYSYIVNLSNEFLTTGVYIYSLDLQSNVLSTSALPTVGSNNLVLEFDNVIKNIAPISWDSPSKFMLRGNNMHMTNIRMFNTPIELEQHVNVLNQYVVRDNQLATIIDNAIPSLGFQKFANAK